MFALLALHLVVGIAIIAAGRSLGRRASPRRSGARRARVGGDPMVRRRR
jgi:hypothetical protein